MLRIFRRLILLAGVAALPFAATTGSLFVWANTTTEEERAQQVERLGAQLDRTLLGAFGVRPTPQRPAAELRAELADHLAAIEASYDALIATHTTIAGATADEWASRAARDRATLARIAKRQSLEAVRSHDSESPDWHNVALAHSTAALHRNSAEQELAAARDELHAVRAAATLDPSPADSQ